MARRRNRSRRENTAGRQTAGTSWSPDQPELIRLLTEAEVTSCRPIMWGSNSTFLISVCSGEGSAEQSLAVYKPRRGETPLWDFPRGTLYRREMATFLVSEALGWSLVPPTVVRDGPYGVGTVQLFIEHDPHQYYASPAEQDRDAAEQIAILDVLLNNADRKAEHCLRALDGRTWAIDHGLTFHTDPKLRTVIWDFASEPIPNDLLADLQTLRESLDGCGTLSAALLELVEPEELEYVRRRLGYLLRTRTHPDPGLHRRAVPWGAW